MFKKSSIKKVSNKISFIKCFAKTKKTHVFFQKECVVKDLISHSEQKNLQ